MKRILTIIIALTFALALCVPAHATVPSITRLEAAGTLNSVSLSGTVSSGMYAIMVELLDTDGSTSLAMHSYAVNEQAFSGELTGISLTAGSTYTLRAANYDGGLWTVTTFTVPAPHATNPSDDDGAPPALDSGNTMQDVTSVSGGIVKLDISDPNLQNVGGNVNIDLSTLALEVTGATFPKTYFETLPENTGSLTIKLTGSTVSFDPAALTSVSGQTNGADVTISVTTYDKKVLSSDVQAIIGDQPVYELSLTAGNVDIHDFGGGKATVSLPYTPKAGENPEYVVIWRMVNGIPQPVACKYDAGTGLITFETGTFSLYVVAYFPFKDVPADCWYYANAVFAYKNGLMDGVGNNSFAPMTEVSRAMMVTTLYRLESKPATMKVNPFTDVQDGQWYTDAIIWAAENKIVTGFGNGLFGPADTLTREQMALILYNYAKYKGYEISGSKDLSAFSDVDRVSAWAESAMKWTAAEGIIQSIGGGKIAPQGSANRAQVAAVLERFMENVTK